MAGRAYSTEAVVLRSIRLGEADRVLHLYTEAHGRVGAVAKGVRKTMSRFGARREPLVGYSTRAGGGVCAPCAHSTEALVMTVDGIAGIETLLAQPLADAAGLGLSERALQDALRVVTASYEYHGGFRLRTLSA